MRNAEQVTYQKWNCVRLANKSVELIVTTDVGPRVIRFGFLGGANEFKEYPEQLGQKGGSEWRIYGGHRLWHAPENCKGGSGTRPYFPDNAPIEAADLKDGIRLVQPVETTTGIQKEMDVSLDPKTTRVTVTHRLRNTGVWPVELAPWALTVMAQGGVCILPMPPRGEHPRDLLPVNRLTLWAYTDMSDARWTWGEKFILLRQESDPAKAKPQKVGAWIPDGWVAYANGGRLFVKKFSPDPAARYADWGCCVETFTNKDMLEVESLGPLTNLAPGAAVEHVEQWFLFRDVPVPANDAAVVRDVLPKVKGAQG